ncbi:MAG: electron transport complex subunit E [Spirochaetaceae bacterium]|nr:MAG: electron transport complex subunit E [Spirochaetaceae bacterium]
MKRFKELTKGIMRENPILVIMLGLCATLACSTNANDAFGMGIAFSFVMVGSNVVVALIRKIVPGQIRIPVFIAVISTFVTIIDLSIQAYQPLLSRSLGVFIPLIVVNCIVMGRAEAYSSKNTVLDSFLDGIGMGIGFTVIITLIGIIREILGEGTITLSLLGLKDKINVVEGIAGLINNFAAAVGLGNIHVAPDWYPSVLIFILPPGAFLVIGFLMAFHHRLFPKE